MGMSSETGNHRDTEARGDQGSKEKAVRVPRADFRTDISLLLFGQILFSQCLRVSVVNSDG